MTFQSSIRKIYFGVADRRQMFRLFDRPAQRPNRWENDDRALFAGEWFEIARAEHDYMLDILPRCCRLRLAGAADRGEYCRLSRCGVSSAP
jgi:hypothetical protein